MGVTVSGLAELSAAMEASPALLAVNLRKAVQVTCGKVKADARSRISGFRHLPHYPYTITYNTKVTAEGIEGEIGPDKALGGQAPLGNLIEYGTSRSAPHPHLGPALDDNAEDLLRGVTIAIQQVL